MGYEAQKLVRTLPRELKLTANARRLLDYLALCANEEEAKEQNGQYFAFPSEKKLLRDLLMSRATLYRALDQLEHSCGFYLITRRGCHDPRSALYDLHIRPCDLSPGAILMRKQSSDARLSASRGKKGARGRDTSQSDTYLVKNTSQNETYFPEEHVSKRDVNTSQNETKTHKNTSQNETQNKEVLGTTRNLNREQGRGGAPAPSKFKNENSKPKIPAEVNAVLDRHAEMWTVCLHFNEGFPLPEKFEAPAVQVLLNQAVTHVGGFQRFKIFRDRPRDASFARKEFLEYLSRHDPAYEAAVREAMTKSLDGAPGKSKAAAARASP